MQAARDRHRAAGRRPKPAAANPSRSGRGSSQEPAAANPSRSGRGSSPAATTSNPTGTTSNPSASGPGRVKDRSSRKELAVRLLGPVDVTLGGIPTSFPGLRRKSVLAILALHPDASGNHRNALFKSLDSDYRTAVTNLSSAIQTIRTSTVQARFEPNADGFQVHTLKDYNLFWDGISTITAPPMPADPATVSADGCPNGGAAIARPSNVSFQNLPQQEKFLDYAYTPEPQGQAPPAGTKELPEVSMCYSVVWTNTQTTTVNGCRNRTGNLHLDLFTRFRMNPNAAWQNARTTSFTWSDPVVFDRSAATDTCKVPPSHIEATTELQNIWAVSSMRNQFINGAGSTNDAGVLNSATTTAQQFLLTQQKFLYDSINNALANPSSPVFAAVRDMNTALRLLQAYTQLGLPIALLSDDLMSSLLFGQFKLLSNMPTEPTIGNAIQTAVNNYSCGTGCAVDTLRPIRNQSFFDPSAPPCAAAESGPGDPLGNCLVDHALRRLGTSSGHAWRSTSRSCSTVSTPSGCPRWPVPSTG